jgi:hypothetical protein
MEMYVVWRKPYLVLGLWLVTTVYVDGTIVETTEEMYALSHPIGVS